MSLVARLQEIFSIIIEDGDHTRIHEFYDETYVEKINGDIKNLSDLELVLRNRSPDMEICIIEQTYLEMGNTVGSTHQLLIKHDDGKKEKANVISVFTFSEDKKLITCDEVVVFDEQYVDYDKNDEESRYNSIYD